MSARPTAARPRAWLLVVAVVAPACFSDGGYHPQFDTALPTTEPDTSTGAPSTGTTASEPATTTPTTTTGEPPAVCGDGVVDPVSEACDDGNRDDGDACLNTCVAAGCGDGVVWLGVEECDLGAGNHPSAPDTCRPTCTLPACGDGGLYAGPLGPVREIAAGSAPIDGGDDAPRMIGAADDGSFVVVWRVTGFLEKISAQRLDPAGAALGDIVELAQQPLMQLRDPVVAVAPNGDYAVAWESTLETQQAFVRSVAADMPAPEFDLTGMPAGSVSLALDPGAALVAAYLAGGPNQPQQVYLRRFPVFTAPDGPDEQQISQHDVGDATSPTVALHPDGSFLVAWGEPDGTIVYRRFAVDLTAGPRVVTDLVVGGGTNNNATPWTGAAVRPSDGAAIVVGRDRDGHLVLRQFDARDVLQGSVQVDDVDARYVPFVDLASDPWGNLAVVWSACGAPADEQPHCGDLASVSRFRWFRSDLVPHTEAPAEVTTRMGMPRPLSLAVAPTGVAAVSRIEGDNVLVHMSPVQCPP
ncbi:hypothetical protein [Nannocystis radixulma]|uniref:Myxococcus cysteine-rich repeat-containing protein n=1 Tax=Nannocystis radixulma TaxID=2995305 RepID=A0ABT5B9R5_9BACT|nr:hypothetical protein [Nannocystis radixulma]MDC0670880.1 hypothetical protein [Nannocystis radixulma]